MVKRNTINHKIIYFCLLMLGFSLPSFAQKSSNKEKHVTIDFTLFPQTRTTVDINRIKTGTVNLGTAIQSFSEELKYGYFTPDLRVRDKDVKLIFRYYFVPELRIQDEDVRFIFRGGLGRAVDLNLVRSNYDASFEVDGSIWIFDLGLDWFFDLEKIPNSIKGLEYDADFSRKSAGVKGWTGVKIGSFTRNFVMVRVGKGYVTTRATKKFNVESVNTEPFDLYREGFQTESASLEVGLRQKRFGQNLRGVANLYQRVIDSPDPLRFGLNQFVDYKLEGTFEVVPFLSHDFFRVLLRANKTLGDRDSLMFSSDPPDVRSIRNFSDFKDSNLQIILRLAF